MSESVKARKETRYYVGRYQIANPKETEEIVHFNEYNHLPQIADNFNYSDGFKQSATASRIAARLNQIEGHIAEDDDSEVRYHYFSYQKNDDVRALDNYTRKVEEKEEETPTETEEEVTEE